MVLLDHPDGVRQKELADALGIGAPSISEFLTLLEDSHYIDRAADPQDRRATRIFLTEKGRARAYEVRDEHDARVGRLFEALTPEEKKELLRLLEKLNGSGIPA